MELSDIYQKASLVQIPSGYKSGTLYSVVPNTSSGDFTVTGDPQGEATRVNKDGLIESVSANVPRLNYDPSNTQDPHLLLEPSSTNLLQRSEDYANSYWLKARVGSSATGFTAPDGSNNATYYEQQSGQTTAAVIYKSGFTSASSNIYTFSIWAKKAEKRYLKLQTRVNSATYRTVFDLQDGVITYDSGNENKKIEEYPNGWYRLSVQRTSTTTDDIIVYYYLNDSAGVSDTVTDSGGVYIWGSQVEQGNYPTSYIPTAGSAVTRTLDKCLNAGSSSLFNDAEGTLFVDLENFDAEARELTLSNGFTDKRITFLFYGSTSVTPNKIRFFVANGTTQVDSSTTLSYNFNQRNKIAFRYKQNDFKAYINGTQVFVDTSGTTPTSLSRFDFASFNGTTGFIEGKIHQAMVFNEALTDQELIQLTT